MRVPILYILLIALGSVTVLPLKAQIKTNDFSIRKAPSRSVCYASFINENTYVLPPAEYIKSKNKSAKDHESLIEITLVNFNNQDALDAFSAAVDIWESLIKSDVTIRITVTWESLGPGVLGSAGPGDYVSNFDGAPRRDIWYPVALAEKITGHDLNDTTDPDIRASFNSNFNSWYFGTNGQTPSGKFDFLTIVLHEIGHGLGITHAYSVLGDMGTISQSFDGQPVVYESFLENSVPENLLTTFIAPSPELKTQLTGNGLFFNSPSVLFYNSQNPGKIYAPFNYTGGSSIAHLDEITYPAGNANSLMSPQVGFAEAIHNPGPIAMGILYDIGWSGVQLDHAKLNNTENMNTPFEIKCLITNDIPYDESSLTLFYRTDGQTLLSSLMIPTGVENEFTASILATGTPTIYEYFISVKDNLDQEITNPGKIYNQGKPITQHFFNFEAGPDLKKPVIEHEPKPFVLAGDPALEIEANITDNIGILSSVIEFLINDVPQSQQGLTLTNIEDSLYVGTITYPAPLSLNDKVKYRIVATDNSVAQNIAYLPETGYIELNAEGFAPTQDFYENDFNNPNAGLDFFGDPVFGVSLVDGFTNGAIHSSHPYPNGQGEELESNYTYQLKVPIRLKEGLSTLKFDEIVLVEPGETGVAFGSSGYYDYVVTEGSKDGGITWIPFANGYDSRAYEIWLAQFNSVNDAQSPPNSAALGNPSLFKTRTIDMLASGKFEVNDEIVIRFRLFADAFVHGWGWAIDNLKIQIDESPPQIFHDQVDYILSNTEPLTLNVNATDPSEVQSISIHYGINDSPFNIHDFLLSEFADQYSLTLDLSALTPGDDLKYFIKAVDKNGIEGVFPSSGSFVASYIDLSISVDQYLNDFNESTSDFAGIFFSIDTPAGFEDGVLRSSNNYLSGFGLDQTSNLTCLLKESIIVSSENPLMTFDEIALIAPDDYIIVEASKDEGKSWISLTNEYNAQNETSWNNTWLGKRNGYPALFTKRTINLIESGELTANDKILIRFRLHTNESLTGWGWAMDNLSIQEPVTALDPPFTSRKVFGAYPNPAHDFVTIKVINPKLQSGEVSILDPQGRLYQKHFIDGYDESYETLVEVSDWPSGLYIARATIGSSVLFIKLMICH